MATQSSGVGALIEPKDGLSYVRGSTEVPLSEATVAQFLRDTAERFPDCPAVVFREQRIRWTWKEFADEVDVLASGLLTLGIAKGDRVGIWSPNRVEWLLTQFASARIGAVLVNINPAYRLAELEYALNKVGCKAIIAAERFKTSMYLEMLQELAPELATQAPGDLHAARLPELRYVIRMCDTETPGMMSFSELIERGRATLDAAQLDALGAALTCHEPINIQFTSGTTGNPKGRDADPQQRGEQRALHRDGDAADRTGRLVHPRPALSLLRDGIGGAGVCVGRREYGVSGRGLRPGRDPCRGS
jgi:fatty-acyl-CoA synthase